MCVCVCVCVRETNAKCGKVDSAQERILRVKESDKRLKRGLEEEDRKTCQDKLAK